MRGDGLHNGVDSNFYQLMVLRGEDFQGIGTFLDQKQLKCTSPELQELLSIMSQCEVASSIQSAPHFSVMIDEMTDLSNFEQVILVIHSQSP